MRGAAAANVGKALLLIAFLAAISGGVGWLLAELRGATLFAFAALLAALGVTYVGDRALLGMLRARSFALAEDPQLRTTADRIASRLRLPPPKLSLIDDGFPRSCVVGRGPRSATLVVSTGLLAALPPDELEALVAHELAHVRARDVLTQTYAVLLASTLLETSRIGGWLTRSLLYVLAPVGVRVRARAAVAEARASRRRRRRTRVGRRRPRSRPPATRPCERPRLVRGIPGDRAAVPGRPVRPGRPGAHVPYASARERAYAPAARRRPVAGPETKKEPLSRLLVENNRRRPTLPGACAPSTIGAGGLNFSVRNGKRCFPAAMTAELSRGVGRYRLAAPSKLHSDACVQNQDLGQLVRVS